MPIPPDSEFVAGAPGEVALRFLLGLVRAGAPDFIALRARREFKGLTGIDPGAFPRSDRRQVEWLEDADRIIGDVLGAAPGAIEDDRDDR